MFKADRRQSDIAEQGASTRLPTTKLPARQL
jgi:hypothetical protein